MTLNMNIQLQCSYRSSNKGTKEYKYYKKVHLLFVASLKIYYAKFYCRQTPKGEKISQIL